MKKFLQHGEVQLILIVVAAIVSIFALLGAFILEERTTPIIKLSLNEWECSKNNSSTFLNPYDKSIVTTDSCIEYKRKDASDSKVK